MNRKGVVGAAVLRVAGAKGKEKGEGARLFRGVGQKVALWDLAAQGDILINYV